MVICEVDEQIKENPWGRMDDTKFVEFTRTMMEKICKEIIEKVEDVDPKEVQEDYDSPAEFAEDILEDAIVKELLESEYIYFYNKEDISDILDDIPDDE